MDPSDIPTLAKKCYERPSLAGFIDGTILIDGDRFSISPVEAATTEQSLHALDSGSDVLIETSFPSNSIPVALGVALTEQEDPRRGGTNHPVVLFSRQGYKTAFDKIHYSRTFNPNTNPESEPIPRYPTDRLSEIGDEWGLWTANKQFQFDLNNFIGSPASVIVDLRAPRWNDTYAPQIEKFIKSLTDTPTVFIADEKDWTIGYEIAEKHSDEHILIQPNHLEASPIEDIPIPQRTPLSTTERILATEDVTYHYYSVSDDKLADLYPRFAAKKIELQNRGIARKAVGGLYNRLIQLPVKPKYWNEVSTTHGYFDSIPQQIDHISTLKEQYDTGSSRLRNFIEVAQQLQGHLNEQHKLQNYLLNAIDRADDSDTPLRLVFSNEREQEAFVFAAEKNGYSLSSTGKVTLATKGDLDPETGVITMFAGAPPQNSYHYEFPSSETVVFIYFAILDEYIKENAKSKSGNNVTHREQYLGTSDIDLDPLDIDSIEAEVKDVVSPVDADYTATDATTDLLGDSSVWNIETDVTTDEDDENTAQETSSSAGSGNSTPEVKRIFEFEEDHEALELTPLSRVTLFDSGKGEIERTRAQNVDVGDTMILIDGIADDLYELVLKSAREREQVREDENLVEGWRDQLNQALASGKWSVKGFQEQLAKMDSEISSPEAISLWRYGHTLAPDDPDDIKRVYQLAQPGLDESMFKNLAKEVAAAAERLRNRHTKIGTRIRPLIEYELDASTTELPSYYDKEMQNQIREDTKRLTVANVTERTVTEESTRNNESTSQHTPSV